MMASAMIERAEFPVHRKRTFLTSAIRFSIDSLLSVKTVYSGPARNLISMALQ
jgi:hypothetical protein